MRTTRCDGWATLAAGLLWLCGAAACGQGCGQGAPPEEAPAEEASEAPEGPPPTVRIEAGGEFVAASVPAHAVLKADATLTLGAPCIGRLKHLSVNEGDLVTEGQELATLDCLEAGVLDARRGALETRIRGLEGRRGELEALRKEGLVETQRVADHDRELLALRGELAETRALIARSGLASGAVSGTTLTLSSPQAGVVADISATVGVHLDHIGAPVLTVVAPERSRVEALFIDPPPEDATFTFVTPLGLRLPLARVSMRPDVHTHHPRLLGTFELQVSEGEGKPAPTLTAGMSGQVEVRLTRPNAGVVPAHALQRRTSPTGAATLCLQAVSAPGRCQPVIALGTRRELVLVTDPEGAPPFVAPGREVLASLPAWTAGGDDAPEPAAAPGPEKAPPPAEPAPPTSAPEAPAPAVAPAAAPGPETPPAAPTPAPGTPAPAAAPGVEPPAPAAPAPAAAPPVEPSGGRAP